MQSEGVDSDHFSGSNSSFLANEKLMSVDSMNSDITGMTNFHVPFFYSHIVLHAYYTLNTLHILYILFSENNVEHVFDSQMMTLIQTTCLMISWSCISISWSLLQCREEEWRARRFQAL